MSENKPKGEVTLLTGEMVPELTDSVKLYQVDTHCPQKWAFIDLKSGNVYGSDENQNLTGLPKKALSVLKKAVKSLKKAASDPPQFVQIMGVGGSLHALDEEGRVWKYTPAQNDNFAFWGQLTNHRALTYQEEKKRQAEELKKAATAAEG